MKKFVALLFTFAFLASLTLGPVCCKDGGTGKTTTKTATTGATTTATTSPTATTAPTTTTKPTTTP